MASGPGTTQSQVHEFTVASAPKKSDMMRVEFWGICSANLQVSFVSRFRKSYARAVET